MLSTEWFYKELVPCAVLQFLVSERVLCDEEKKEHHFHHCVWMEWAAWEAHHNQKHFSVKCIFQQCPSFPAAPVTQTGSVGSAMDRNSKKQQMLQEVPCKMVSRLVHKDPEIRLFLDENTVKIVALNKWAAREISQESSDCETEKTRLLAVLLAKASDKVDNEWFGSLNHPRKDELRDIVMFNIECAGIGILGKCHLMTEELLGPELPNNEGIDRIIICSEIVSFDQ
jgi:hypothetical protein